MSRGGDKRAGVHLIVCIADCRAWRGIGGGLLIGESGAGCRSRTRDPLITNLDR